MRDKRPRIYAFEITAEKSREKRIDMLDKVPDKYKALVKEHVVSIYSLRKYKEIT